jgi:uncharacterized membrane protein
MSNSKNGQRIQSLDFLRGIVMVLMVLDHVRHFFHYAAITDSPENLATTTPILFLTRWVTHFCAPVFIFLVGISAFLYEQKVNSKYSVSKFLLTRGIFLIILELTVFKFAWHFQYDPKEFTLLVIWAIGISMIFLAGIIYLNQKLVLVFGLLIVFGHNLFDKLSFTKGTLADAIWKLLHAPGGFKIGDTGITVLFPVLPYFGLIMLGYCLGSLYTAQYDPEKRRRILLWMGIGCCALFVLLRLPNLYGDMAPWSRQKNVLFTLLSFIKTTKYPTSLLYLLMTIGPSLIFLSLAENINNAISRIFIVFGSVPMYFYLWHLFLIHGAALLSGGINAKGLAGVYIATTIISVALYFLCKQYAKYKFAHKKGWLSYI